MTAQKSQPSSSGKFGIIGGTMAAVLLLAASFVKPWEGTVPKAYFDVVGVLTICTGHTGPDVSVGQVASPARCEALLKSDLGRTYTHLAGCIHAGVTVPQMVAITSLAFNTGSGAICRSTLVRQLNAGYPPSVWCKQVLRWDKAGGRTIRGLTNRRKAEYKVCMGEAA